MTKEHLDAIRARHEAATRGPWTLGGVHLNIVGTEKTPIQEICHTRYTGSVFSGPGGKETPDAAFIAASWQDVKDMLDALEEAERRNEPMNVQLEGRWIHCPSCNRQLYLQRDLPQIIEQNPFCCYCGQRLRWEERNNV